MGLELGFRLGLGSGVRLGVRLGVGVRVGVSAEDAVVAHHLHHVNVRGEDKASRAEHAGYVHPVYLLRSIGTCTAAVRSGCVTVDEVSMYTGHTHLGVYVGAGSLCPLPEHTGQGGEAGHLDRRGVHGVRCVIHICI